MKWAVDGPVGWKAQRSACSAVRPHKERPQSIFPPFVDWHGLVLSSSSTPQKKIFFFFFLDNCLKLLPFPVVQSAPTTRSCAMPVIFSQNGSNKRVRCCCGRMTHRQIRRGVCISLTHDCDVLGYFIYIYNNISFLPHTRGLTNQIRAHLFPKNFSAVLIKSNLQT